MKIEPHLVRAWRSLRSLPRQERWTLALAWHYLLISAVALRFLSFPTVERLLARLPARSGLTAGRLASLVGVAARHHVSPMTCLPKALALLTLLGRQEAEAELRIGVRREENGLRAHAWVEHAGSPLGEPMDLHGFYAPLVHARSAG